MVSTNWGWIIGIISVIIGGLLFIFLGQTITYHLHPQASYLLTNNTLLNATQIAEGEAELTRVYNYWAAIPFLILIGSAAYVIISAIRGGKGGVEQ